MQVRDAVSDKTLRQAFNGIVEAYNNMPAAAVDKRAFTDARDALRELFGELWQAHFAVDGIYPSDRDIIEILHTVPGHIWPPDLRVVARASGA